MWRGKIRRERGERGPFFTYSLFSLLLLVWRGKIRRERGGGGEGREDLRREREGREDLSSLVHFSHYFCLVAGKDKKRERGGEGRVVLVLFDKMIFILMIFLVLVLVLVLMERMLIFLFCFERDLFINFRKVIFFFCVFSFGS